MTFPAGLKVGHYRIIIMYILLAFFGRILSADIIILIFSQ
jgi:hypothetical protein